MLDVLEFAVRCSLGDWAFLQRVTNEYNLEMLKKEIMKRHNILFGNEFKLSYSTPGSKESFLNNDDDWVMMLYAVRRYQLDVVEISVCLNDGLISSSAIFDQSPTVLDENQFLGAAYRDNVGNKFLCDEWGSYISGVGQKFRGGVVEFRDKFRKYAIQIGFYFFFQMNDSRYLYVVCEDVDCPFFVSGSLRSSDSCFYIKDCHLGHNCSVVRARKKSTLIGSEIVSECMQTDVLYNLSITPNDIKNKFKVYYGFEISYKVALNARYRAVENIYGSGVNSFNKLIWYRNVVLESNSGSIFEVEVDLITNRFVRVFVCYGACVSGFQYCLPVLYVDGCFGKSSYKCQVIAATSKNGNKGIYPVATCICESESADNLLFFFKNLKRVTDGHSRMVSFISDRGLGLLHAFDQIYKGNPHIFCFFHLKQNLRARLKNKGNCVMGNKVEELFIQCAYSSSGREYNFNMNLLRDAGGAKIIDEFFKDLPVEHWCRTFGVGTRFGIMANSVTECYNNWINLERAMPVYTMLEEVRMKQMEMISNRRIESSNWKSLLTPTMELNLVGETNKCRRFKVINSCEGVYEVKDVYSYLVNLGNKECSCKKWEINGFSCPHAIAAISDLKDYDVYNFIDPVYSADTFRKCYSHPIIHVTNVDFEYFEQGCPRVEPPVVKRQPGRRRTSRFKSAYEVSKKSKKITCGRCKRLGSHNRKTCKESLQ